MRVRLIPSRRAASSMLTPVSDRARLIRRFSAASRFRGSSSSSTDEVEAEEARKARWDGRVKFDRQAYRGRCVVEQCVGWLKEFRRIGTRFEKLAVNFHGMLQLAMIRRYLKMLFSDRT